MICDLKENDIASDYFLLSNLEICSAKSGKQFGRITIEDASGKIQGVMWENTHQLTGLTSGDVVFAGFIVKMYKEQLQITVTSIKKADSDSVPMEKLIITSRFDNNEMLSELLDRYVSKIQDSWLLKLTQYFYMDSSFIKKFRDHPAASSIHHAYSGGLLQHTLNVTRLAAGVADNYDFVNKDLTVTVALLHDIGKMNELQPLPAHGFTSTGNFIGHVVESQNMVRDACNAIAGFPETKKELVCHCILAHHGTTDFGSPKVPSVVEAVIVHLCDMIDSRTEIYHDAIASGLPNDGFTNFNTFANTRITDQSLY